MLIALPLNSVEVRHLVTVTANHFYSFSIPAHRNLVQALHLRNLSKFSVTFIPKCW
jgi:hypothetical protein